MAIKITVRTSEDTHAAAIQALVQNYGLQEGPGTLSTVVNSDQVDAARAAMTHFGEVEVEDLAIPAATESAAAAAPEPPSPAPEPPSAAQEPSSTEAPAADAPAVECALYFWGAHKRFLMQRGEQFERDTAGVAVYRLPYTLWDGLRWGLRFTTQQPEAIGEAVNSIEGTWGLYVNGAWCAGTELPPAPGAPHPVGAKSAEKPVAKALAAAVEKAEKVEKAIEKAEKAVEHAIEHAEKVVEQAERAVEKVEKAVEKALKDEKHPKPPAKRAKK